MDVVRDAYSLQNDYFRDKIALFASIVQAIYQRIHERNESKPPTHQNIVKGLKEKDCFYLKADKGNKVVIIDKKDYFERVDSLIQHGPYTTVSRNPLAKMTMEIKNTLKRSGEVYCLPKMHKPGKAMRPIVSAIGKPSYNISKWLVEEFKKLIISCGNFEVPNSFVFMEKLKDIHLEDNEILVSFDVSSLFPSVPIPQTLEYLRELLQLNNLSPEAINEYLILTKLCMDQNYFLYNNNVYQQLEGTAMDKLINKHKHKRMLREVTNRQQNTPAKDHFVVIPYDPRYTRGLEKNF
ncbi:uncharacterized protein LOC132696986 [Cylas formicarius]|uniref:uncharacterized protein LOC132696986 n=1 Tax=Cylas formicarius TaxID=197179 RepID=UPI0029588456|nr:uncharacterized protein LOC132696986 [Cylas formicarius]